MSAACAEQNGQPLRSAFTRPREFLGNQFVYVVVSSRARGLSVGIDMAPAGQCSFNCLYCEVDRNDPRAQLAVDLDVMSAELTQTLQLVRTGAIKQHDDFSKLPPSLLELRHVALSGNGEPTLSRQFAECVETVAHVRARSRQFFKIVLITNGTGLNLPDVERGLKYFTSEDEIWIKLDAGTQAYAERLHGHGVNLDQILTNILRVGKVRPITIQSLFPAINGEGPTALEIDAYVNRLAELKGRGAKVNLVQIYSADRPSRLSVTSHLPLKILSGIARNVRTATGLRAEVF